MSEKYGNDVILWDSDFVFGPNSDLQTTSDYETNNPATTLFPGYYNIVFSVFNRLSTVKGEIPFHPTYGSSLTLLISKPNNKSLERDIRDAFEDILQQDPRVAQVRSVIVEANGNEASVKAELVLTGKAESSIFIFPNFFIDG